MLKHSLFDVRSAILSEAGAPETHISEHGNYYNRDRNGEELRLENAKTQSEEGNNKKLDVTFVITISLFSSVNCDGRINSSYSF